MGRGRTFLPIFVIFTVLGATLALYHSTQVSKTPFPFVVSLRNADGQHIECGTIISKKHVLAYAWTIVTHKPKSLEAGSIVLGEGRVYQIEKSVVHEEHHVLHDQNAIGIIWIVDEFYFNRIQPAELAPVKISAGNLLLAVGWGSTEKEVKTDQLQQASFQALSDEDCKSALEEAGWSEFYGGNILCAKGVKSLEQKWCWYDYGAPLISGGMVVGLIHNPKNCPENPKNINLATRVEPYLDWIEEQIKSELNQTRESVPNHGGN